MAESIYLATLVGTALVLAAAFSSLIAFRYGAPLLLIFLLIGLLTGVDGLGIHFDNAPAAYFVGSVALAVILFDSGFGTPVAVLRQAGGPALSLSTIGVVVTAGIFGTAAHFVLSLSWTEAFLFGAIVGSTDAAAVFFLLRTGNVAIRDRVRSILEIESGSNDPIAIFLTISLVGIVTAAGDSHAGQLAWQIGLGFLKQMGTGAIVGLAGGWAIVRLVERLDLDRGLLPIFVIFLSLLVFGIAGAAGGSGFLAAYVAGIVAGNRDIRSAAFLKRFQEGVSWLAQIIMFLVLGLFATPSQFPAILLSSVFLAAFLIFVARPAAVWLCLAPFRFPRAETAFISWVGLRGAVSILLALLPLVGGLENGRLLFNAAFIVVLVSLIVQGWTVLPLARRLGLVVPPRVGPIDKVELELPGAAHHELLAYRVVEGSPVALGQRIPRWARPALIMRDGRSMTYQYAGRLQADDHVYIFVPDRYPRLLDRLFASPAAVDPDDADFFGAFALDPDRPAHELEAAYGPGLNRAETDMSIGTLMTRRLGGRAELADRVPFGPVELIVREVDEEGTISAVGLALEQTLPPQVPAFLSPGEIADRIGRHLKNRRFRDKSALAPLLRNAIFRTIFRRGGPPMSRFRTLDDIGDITGKRVLVRVDLNVPVKDGKVTDTTRIERVVPTITELSGKGAKVILLAHFGRPKGERVTEMSLKPVAAAAEQVLDHRVHFAEDCVGDAARKAIDAMADGDILLLENTRFHKGEEKNDPDLVRQMATLGDIYVNDAFSAAHRAHASTEGLAHHLPAYAGRSMQAELDALEKGLGNPARPVVAIVGGAKVSTKLDLLGNLVKKVDALVIGGGMANTFLAAKGVDVGKSLCEHELGDTARSILSEAEKANCAIVLPVDAVVAREFKADAENETVAVDAVPADGMILDVGPQSVEAVNAWMDKAATLVWNGPLGAFEIAPFDRATVAAAKHAAALTREGRLVSVAGGGDTVAALHHAGVADDFTYVSTAGGAFLEWMEGKVLPGVEALKA